MAGVASSSATRYGSTRTHRKAFMKADQMNQEEIKQLLMLRERNANALKSKTESKSTTTADKSKFIAPIADVRSTSRAAPADDVDPDEMDEDDAPYEPKAMDEEDDDDDDGNGDDDDEKDDGDERKE
jgi:hypothetical protein